MKGNQNLNFNEQVKEQKNIWVLTPFFGIVLFVILYWTATFFYPGGSQVDKYSTGFSWKNNYWCNLLSDYAINGQPNNAKPIAGIGLFVLCITLSFFWFLFPRHIKVGKYAHVVIRISGTLAMTAILFLFTNINHDLVINMASILGLVATSGIFIGLYKSKLYKFFAFGLINIFLIGLNTIFYYDKELIIFLPIIQKISFATFLAWVSCLNIHLFHSANNGK